METVGPEFEINVSRRVGVTLSATIHPCIWILLEYLYGAPQNKAVMQSIATDYPPHKLVRGIASHEVVLNSMDMDVGNSYMT